MLLSYGFTLIELIVVIAILAILALIAIPRLGGFTETARQANDEELAAIVANSAAMLLASDPDTAPSTAKIAASGFVEDKYISGSDLKTGDALLPSKKYSALTLTSSTSEGWVQVTLTATTGVTDNYVIRK